ncbi:gliding motility-associated C-terminal domain-containing protein [Runella sp. MFBS21]|uniref:gliding motility-associated C-terminal domain-containing protein n=1 Tax=Runella sp. MFBS21 TaxID=3034018 RepID=UPI0023FA3761|nr:gliding motility-associated C-terminal domain-containing protein [Runella sp. MFBS21]MDF7816113.1 gliding motility-associated C-terminal domain-containing protein [Runella sp. MFBS21]
MKCLITCGLVLLVWSKTWANHLMGGDVSITKRGTSPNTFTITLTLVYDQVQSPEDKAFVSVFRKNDHTRMDDFTLTRVVEQALPYQNASCINGTPSTKISYIKYEANVTLLPSNYNHLSGYYLAWEECCRNNNVLNIQANAGAGLVFYCEIPPLTTSNSSPQFATPQVKFACIGKNFEASFAATDLDGDELRYSLVTPLAGNTDPSGTFPSMPNAGPYRKATWNAGYDSTRAITGTIPPKIDSRTGQLSLNPSQIGTYVVAVKCEEWRNGSKIGEVRREFVLNVVDCISTQVPPAYINLKDGSPSITFDLQPNGHVQTVGLCKGDSVVLKADDENPRWSYQWLKNGQLVSTTPTVLLSIKEEGVYSIVKRFKESCGAEDSTTNTTKVNFKLSPNAAITSSRPLPICSSDSTNLSVTTTSNTLVEWRFNGIVLPNIDNVLAHVKQGGLYKVKITDNNSRCTATDSLLVKSITSPLAQLMISGAATFCSNDSVKLFIAPNNAYNFVWYKNDFPLVQAIGNEFRPRESGQYSVSVEDTASKCLTHSSAINVVVKPAPQVTLDSIPSVCTASLQAITLNGLPEGGIYSGTGVVGNRFVSANLPSGRYPITYTYTSPEGCTGKDTKAAFIAPPPRFSIPSKLVVLKGDSVKINTSLPLNASISWFPSTGLNNDHAPQPTASPDLTTTYYATLISTQGCVAEGEVTVVVINLDIPNGFTPNHDGANETWEISGIFEYPNCVVEVFNRWGNLVFSSKGYETPWDGNWNGQPVPVGAYYYQIYLREVEFKLTGTLNIIR